jgi:hypothetical protein
LSDWRGRYFIGARADMYGDAFLDLYSKIAVGDRKTIEAPPKPKRRWSPASEHGRAHKIFAPSHCND